jgi:hypothetical protein
MAIEWISGGRKKVSDEEQLPSTAIPEEKEYTNKENPLQWLGRMATTGAVKAVEYPFKTAAHIAKTGRELQQAAIPEEYRKFAPGIESPGILEELSSGVENLIEKPIERAGGEGYLKAHGKEGSWQKPFEEILHTTMEDLPETIGTGGANKLLKAGTSLASATGAKIAEKFGANPLLQTIVGYSFGRIPRWMKTGFSPKKLMEHAETEKQLAYNKEKEWRVKNGEPSYHSPELVEDSKLIGEAYGKEMPSVKEQLGKDVEHYHEKMKNGTLTIQEAKDIKQRSGEAAYDSNLKPGAKRIFAAIHKNVKTFLENVANKNPEWGNEFKKAEELHGAISEAKKIGTIEKTGKFKKFATATKAIIRRNIGSLIGSLSTTPKEKMNMEIADKLVEKSPFMQEHIKQLRNTLFYGDYKSTLSLMNKLDKEVIKEEKNLPEKSKLEWISGGLK